MAETLTYDPTPADNPELSPEEQDSLQVGEKLAEQEQELLAGNFQNAEELEKAYVELQKKFGEKGSEDSEAVSRSDDSDEGKEPSDATEAATEANLSATQTIGTSVSKTVIGTQINITATTVNSLFGSNAQLRTTLTVVGLDSGARITVPVTVTKQSLTTT